MLKTSHRLCWPPRSLCPCRYSGVWPYILHHDRWFEVDTSLRPYRLFGVGRTHGTFLRENGRSAASWLRPCRRDDLADAPSPCSARRSSWASVPSGHGKDQVFVPMRPRRAPGKSAGRAITLAFWDSASAFTLST